MKVVEMSARLLSPTTKDEGIGKLKLIEYAGRNCYRSHDKMTDDSYKTFIVNLMHRGHESPLEFAEMAIEVVTSRDVLAELTRHRHASFAVQSQRYVQDDKSGEISFIKPNFYVPSEPNDADNYHIDWKAYRASRVWEAAMKDAECRYCHMTKILSMPAQDARKVLPNSTACVIVMKANLREWIHIFNLRDSVAAYPEMQTLMSLILPLAREVFPIVFDRVGKSR